MLEITTEEVIDWIYYLGHSFIRINGEDIYNDKSINVSFLDNKGIVIHKKKLNSSNNKVDISSKEFNIGWYRRWSDNFSFLSLSDYELNNQMYDSILRVLRTEEVTLKNYFLNSIHVKKWLSKPSRSNVNKLIVLDKAKSLGLRIPKSIICSGKKQLTKFIHKYENIITKALCVGLTYQDSKSTIYNFTERVNKYDLDTIPTKFPPTLFQEMISKQYEIRTFYLDGAFYSMCIFSQLDHQTSTDFRVYNNAKPNRTVPYKLPKELEDRLKALMDELDLETGSIDLIKGIDGNYYFLEVNPVGQFGMTSYPCNYYLERKVAEYLTKHDF